MNLGSTALDDIKVLESELVSVQDLSFAFKRAASRMSEMTSREYHDKWKLKYDVKYDPIAAAKSVSALDK